MPLALSIIPNDDVEAAADMMRPMLALYIGGMGAREMNFHFEVFARMGYEETCIRIQELYLAGEKRDAIAAVPTKMVEEVALIGPVDKIKDELPRWTRHRRHIAAHRRPAAVPGDGREDRLVAHVATVSARRSMPSCSQS